MQWPPFYSRQNRLSIIIILQTKKFYPLFWEGVISTLAQNIAQPGTSESSDIANRVAGQIRGRLVVSCQAYPGDPLEDTEALRRIALASVAGGAAGLRVNSAEDITAIRRDTDLPIIGINKKYSGGELRITPDFASAAELAAAGADIIALDCTGRLWNGGGDPWREIIKRVHRELKIPVMADIATVEEALAAADAGADFIGMTLNGYTEETKGNHGFNWEMLATLVERVGRPIIAEGHISTPVEARRAIQCGAWSVVVGSAITRPGVITTRFVKAMAPALRRMPAIGVDIGGTSVKAGLVDREGRVTLLERVPTHAGGGRDAISAAVVKAIESVMRGANGIPLSGLGIASAGAIDSATGMVFAATDNLPGWADFDLRGFAEDCFHLPVQVNNDAQAAVLAELRFGLGRRFANLAAVTIGTGVGGGIISAGRLARGNHGLAGSFGHQTIRFDGRQCNCGRRGCLEAYVSAKALVQEYEARRDSQSTGESDDTASRALEVSRLATAGDAAALAAYDALAGYLAEGVANIFNGIDPDVVVLSGGVVEGHERFAAEVERRTASLLHFGYKRKPRVQLSRAGHYAGVQGAAAAVFEAEEDQALAE